MNYKADLYDGYMYFGQGFKSDPASISTRPITASNKNEQVAGFLGSFSFFDGLKSSFYGHYYKTDNLAVDVAGTSELSQMSSYFFGGTFEVGSQDAFNAQLSIIGNWNKTVAQSQSENYFAHLIDAKVGFVWEAPRLNFSLEGLMTPGSTSGSLGSRKNFQSNTATHYLFNIAGSDGWDDAPGSARDYIVGKSSNQEGLDAFAMTVSSAFTKKLNSYVRGGIMKTSAEHSVTHSKDYGKEFDFGASYQLTPSTSWQFDFGEFMPGEYFGTNVAPVYLGATKIKFSF